MCRFAFSIICVLLLFLSELSHGQESENPGTIVVTGKWINAEGQKISLFSVDRGKEESGTKVKKESFTLAASAGREPAIFALQADEQDFPLMIAGSSGDTVKISGDFADFPLMKVTGNKQSEEMQAYQKEFIPFFRRAQDLNGRASLITSEDDTEAILSLQKEAKELSSEMQSAGMEFIQYHPDALASIVVLMKQRQTFSPEQLKQLYSSLSENIKQSTYGKMVGSFIHSSILTAVGATAPEFTQKDMDGKPVSLSSFRGKYVLIDFWASWCGPCRAENPNVVAVYKKFKDKNFTILGVSLDKEKNRWKKAIEHDHLDWTQVSDLKGWDNEVARLYHITSIPRNFLIDPSGKIIAENLRGISLEKELVSIFENE